MKSMKKQPNLKKNRKKPKKLSFNMYAWSQKYKKTFAGAICIVLALAMLISIIQF